MKVEERKRRFDCMIRFLIVGSLFNGSICICEVSSIRDDNIVLDDILEPNVMWKRTVLKVNFSVFLSKIILKIVSFFLFLSETFSL